MTIKELKEILANYADDQVVALTIVDEFDSFLAIDISQATLTKLNGLELEVTLPEPYYIGEQ